MEGVSLFNKTPVLFGTTNLTLGGYSTAAYDLAGNTLAVTPALGNGQSMAYDDDGILRSSTDPLGKVATNTVTDATRQVTDKIDNLAERTYTKNLDPRGLVTSVDHPFGTDRRDRRGIEGTCTKLPAHDRRDAR